jgi:hypothetical protein
VTTEKTSKVISSPSLTPKRAEYGSLNWYLIGLDVMLGMDILDFLRALFSPTGFAPIVPTFFPPEIPSTTPGYHPVAQSQAYEEMHEKVASGERHYETIGSPPPVHVEPMEEGPKKEATKAAYEEYAAIRMHQENQREVFTSANAIATPQPVVDRPATPAPPTTPTPTPTPDSSAPPQFYTAYDANDARQAAYRNRE